MATLEHEDALNFITEWQDGTKEQRELARKCKDFYHTEQLTPAEKATMRERGQPEVEANKIGPKVDFVRGMLNENRTDPRALPRTPVEQGDSEAIASALRYVDDRTRFGWKSSEVENDVLQAGVGGHLFELEEIKDVQPGKPRKAIQIVQIPEDRLIYDPYARDPFFNDAKFVGFFTWMDVEDAEEIYPDAEPDVFFPMESSGSTSYSTDIDMEDKPLTYFDKERERVQVFDLWYRKGKYWYYCAVTASGFAHKPYKLNFVDDAGKYWCPLRLVSGYIDRNNQRYGIIKRMLSPQEEINKRRSKFLWLASMRQVAIEEGAHPDPVDLAQQLGRPDGIILLKPGSLERKRFELLQTNDLAQAQFALYQASVAELDAAGPSAAVVAAQQRDISARSFLAQQQAGMREISPVINNLREYKQQTYRCIWYLIRQFWTEEIWLNVLDNSEGWKFVGLNRRMTNWDRIQGYIAKGVDPQAAYAEVLGPDLMRSATKKMQEYGARRTQQLLQEGADQEQIQQIIQQESEQVFSQTEEAKMEYIATDVAKLDLDIVIDLVPENPLLEFETYQQIVELVRHGVQIPAETIIRMAPIPNKKEILESMKPDPQMQEMQMQQMQLQMQQLQAAVQKLTAEAQKAGAEAQKALVDAQVAPQEAAAKIDKDTAAAEKSAAEAAITPFKGLKEKAQALKATAEARATRQTPAEPVDKE